MIQSLVVIVVAALVCLPALGGLAQTEPPAVPAPSPPAPESPAQPDQPAPEISPEPSPATAPAAEPMPVPPDASAPPVELRAPAPTPEAPATQPVPPPAVMQPLAPTDVPPPVAAEPGPNALSEGQVVRSLELDEPWEVIVVGTRLSETAGSAHVLDEEKLARWEYDDVHSVLSSVPGVYVRQEDGMGLRPNIGLRGVNPDRSKKITLLEDGILFGPAPYSAPAAYYFPIMTRLSEVRVIKGPAAISYGPQTVGGAIDLITRPIPTQTAALADIAVGSYGYGKAHVYAGSSVGRLGVLIEGVRLQSNGFKELPNGADTGFVRNEWMAKASYAFDRRKAHRNELRVKLSYSDEVSNESYLGLSDADLKDNPNRRYGVSKLDRMSNHRAGIVLTHELELGEDLSITTNVYRIMFDRTWRKVNGFRGASLFDVLRDPEAPNNAYFHALLTGEVDSTSAREAILIGPNERTFVSQGAESRLNFETRTGPVEYRLEAGLRFHYDAIDRRHSENGFLIQGGELIPDGGPTAVNAFNKGSSHAVASHAQVAVSFAGLTLTPGLRAEFMRFMFDDHLLDEKKQREFVYAVLPGAGAYYAITDSLGLLAGVHRGFSPPPPESAKNNDPESSINYEGGVRLADGALRVESIGFYNDYENLTDVCTFSSGCSEDDLDEQFDAGRARIYGAEVFAAHELPAGPVKLPLLASYTYTRGEFLRSFMSTDPIFGNVREGDEMPYLPRHQVRGSLGVEHVRGGASAALTYVPRMREEPGQGSVSSKLHTDKQLLVDVNARAHIWGPLALYVSVQNLLDSQPIVSHRPFGARPNAPRWLHVGIKAEL